MYLTILPLFALVWPAVVFVERPWVDKDDDDKPLNNGDRVGITVGTSIVLLAVVAIVSGPFRLFKTFPKDSFWDAMTQFGMLIWIVAIMVEIYYLAKAVREMIKDNIRERKYQKTLDAKYAAKEPQKNLLVEFIKAKYKKHCPRIEWTSKTNA